MAFLGVAMAGLCVSVPPPAENRSPTFWTAGVLKTLLSPLGDFVRKGGFEEGGVGVTHPIGLTSLAFFCVRGSRSTAAAIPPAMAMLRGRLAIWRKLDMFARGCVIESIGVEWKNR